MSNAPVMSLAGRRHGKKSQIAIRPPGDCQTSLAPMSQGPLGDANLHAFVYERLHALAHGQLKQGVRFAQTTSLVHEAYLRLLNVSENLSRNHFFAVAATVMRQILIDRARAAYSMKRGGGEPMYSLSDVGELSSDDPAALLRVDAALNQVRAVDPRLATLVELKVFGGLDVAELADALEISERSVKRYWRQARALLIVEFAG